MIKKRFPLGSAVLLACAWALAYPAGAAELREARFWSSDYATRLVLGVSKPTAHNVFTLSNPDRVVIDLEHTRLAASTRLPAAQGIVQAIRTGVQPRGTLRVVLELKTPVTPRVQWAEATASSGHRLVIELARQGPAVAGAAVAAESTAAPRAVRAAHAPGDGNRDIVVAIDAGHGGQDPGAIGPGGTREKDVVLAIARALARRIDAEPGMRAVLTRGDDRFLRHRDRIARARAAGADLFVSVHADSIANRQVSGSSVYILSERGASSEAARWLAERENAADLKGGVSLDDKDQMLASVLLDLSQSASISASMVAAERVLKALADVGEVRKREVQQAGFLVLKSPDIPSMLVETAYISNPGDERRLKSGTHQNKLAEAIFQGVRSYFEHHPPPGTRFARERRSGAPGVVAGTAAP